MQRPTLLAKVLGCYKISFKKSGRDKGSGRWKSTQMNLIVMENLFYDRRFSKVCWSSSVLRKYLDLLLQIYDLKGSTRNRHVKSTGRENEVLLDENLVQSESRVSKEDFGSYLRVRSSSQVPTWRPSTCVNTPSGS